MSRATQSHGAPESVNAANSGFDIGVIGGGASAALFLHHLAKRITHIDRHSAVSIAIFEPRTKVGPGYAYQDDTDEQLLNAPIRAGSMFHDKPDDLWCWLVEEAPNNPSVGSTPLHFGPNGYIPRWLYGLYVNHRQEQAIADLQQKGVRVFHVTQRVACVRQIPSLKYVIRTELDNLHIVSHAIFCMGNHTPSDNYNLRGNSAYIHIPYPLRLALKEIPPEASVAILGTQLTGTDVALALCQRGHKGPIVLVSRSHELPVVRSQVVDCTLKHLTLDALQILRKSYPEGLALRQIFRLLRREFLEHSEDWRHVFFRSMERQNAENYFSSCLLNNMKSSNWQSIMLAMDLVVEECWDALCTADKAVFLSRFDRLWMTRRAPIPAPNAYKLHTSLRQRRIHYRPYLQKVSPSTTGGFELVHQSPTSTNEGRESSFHSDWVINATGPARDLQFDRGLQPFKELIDQDLVALSRFGGVECSFETSALLDTDGRASQALYAIGHSTLGTYYFVASILMHSKHAKRVASAIAGQLFRASRRATGQEFANCSELREIAA